MENTTSTNNSIGKLFVNPFFCIFIAIVAGMLFGFGLIAPLTPDEVDSVPETRDILIFFVIPVVLQLVALIISISGISSSKTSLSHLRIVAWIITVLIAVELLMTILMGLQLFYYFIDKISNILSEINQAVV